MFKLILSHTETAIAFMGVCMCERASECAREWSLSAKQYAAVAAVVGGLCLRIIWLHTDIYRKWHKYINLYGESICEKRKCERRDAHTRHKKSIPFNWNELNGK